MSRSIAANIIAKLESNQITKGHLLKYTVDSDIYCFTDMDVPVPSDVDGTSRMYQPRKFEFDSINFSNNNIIDSASLKIDNVDGELTPVFVDNTIIDEPAAIYFTVFDDDNTVLNSQQIFSGILNDFELDESQLAIAITSTFTKWDQTSNLKHGALCQWKVFKSTGYCNYSGSETKCDRTYARCIELGNTDNFGGNRWLPAMEDLEIYWGPTPTQSSIIN